jgi:hypothetical protein
MSDKTLYWAYNLPLQVHPFFQDEDDESSPVIKTEIVNYMPRKERCIRCDLAETLEICGQTREEFFETAATYLENLARLMRMAAKDPAMIVYYHDDDDGKVAQP